MMEVLNVVAIIVAGLMVGSELAIAAFVHPTLDKLPDDVHLPAASAFQAPVALICYHLRYDQRSDPSSGRGLGQPRRAVIATALLRDRIQPPRS